MFKIGMKVASPDEMHLGVGHVARVSPREVLVHFATSARAVVERKFAPTALKRRRVPEETRCYYAEGRVQRYGRVLVDRGQDGEGFMNYLVRLPNTTVPVVLREDRFTVRSYLVDHCGPTEVLADLAQETPFFFEHRMNLLEQLLKQKGLARGFTGLLSAKILLFRHQIEVVARIAADPVVRYLLADEVGLGKTIETGIVLRQVILDAPTTRVAVYVPTALVAQWETELTSRFGLGAVAVCSHEALAEPTEHDFVVVDEAHRVVASPELMPGAQAVARASKHLLLLTATPGLHDARALLSLLHLLDPKNYSPDDFEAFATTLARRSELGRAILALQASSVPALMQRQIRLIEKILPEDGVVAKLVASQANGEDLGPLRTALVLHLTETYRLHRRMLRTRRIWLAESDRFFLRRIKCACEYELEEKPFMHAWATLEEWRTSVSGRLQGDANRFTRGASAYIRLAEIVACPADVPAGLATMFAKDLGCSSDERRLLDELVAWVDAQAKLRGRIELLAAVIGNRLGKHAKGVIFCPAGEVALLGQRLRSKLGRESVLTAVAESPVLAAQVAREFAAGPARLLVADAVMEEGFNLQVADFLVFHDLPWAPMRLEQRIGRLDRIDRVGPIDCVLLVTGEDETLCVDEAWRQVLVEGLGIFGQSISDLQHLLDANLQSWRERLFGVGPGGIQELISQIKLQVVAERQALDEQDAIDGMSQTADAAQLEQALQQADKAAPDLQRAAALYLRENIGLQPHWREEDNTILFALKREAAPLIPMERLGAIRQMLNRPATTLRQVAVESLESEFLRPGHPAVAACEELLEWDDRGRAFALWRRLPTYREPEVVFRCLVRVKIDLQNVEEALQKDQWDEIERGGLMRLIQGWFGEFYEDCFLDVSGDPVSAALIADCKLPYQKPRDQNLGKERTADVQAEFGFETWAEWCQVATNRALDQVRKGDALKKKTEQAQQDVTRHFDLLRARLTARKHAGVEGATAIREELARQQTLQGLVGTVLKGPTIYLDAIGAYVLSARPLGGATPE